jgi:hypothetical protein
MINQNILINAGQSRSITQGSFELFSAQANDRSMVLSSFFIIQFSLTFNTLFLILLNPCLVHGSLDLWSKIKKLITAGITLVFCTLLKVPEEACCNNKQIIDHFAIIHLVGHWLTTESIMQTKKANKESLLLGVNFFGQLATEVLKSGVRLLDAGWWGNILAISRVKTWSKDDVLNILAGEAKFSWEQTIEQTRNPVYCPWWGLTVFFFPSFELV